MYPFTVFKTRSLSDKFPLLADHGTEALTSPWDNHNNCIRTEVIANGNLQMN